MASKRVLVVTTASVEPDRLREEVLRHVGDENAEVKIVAPASDVSRLQWLANDEDEAREEAAQQADEAAEAVEPAASVETEVGDSDPVQAVEDALRTFPADADCDRDRERGRGGVARAGQRKRGLRALWPARDRAFCLTASGRPGPGARLVCTGR